MEQNEVIEGNKLIVIFMNGEIDMGVTHVTDSYTDESGKKVFKHIEGKAYLNFVGDDETGSYEKACMVANLKYHSSWEWIMPVVKKISHTMPILPNWDKIVEYLADVDIDKCFEQVVLSIKWYNNKKDLKLP